MNQNEIKDKFESVHLPINRYFWRFCGLFLFYFFYFMVMCRLLKVLCVSSQKNCFPVLSAWSPLLSSKVPCENSFRLLCSEKTFLYAWILSFIYKAAHSLWNILFPFFPTCVWIWEAHYVWLTWRFPQGCNRILFGKWSDPL